MQGSVPILEYFCTFKWKESIVVDKTFEAQHIRTSQHKDHELQQIDISKKIE
jgi:hypothetical protein